MSRLAKLFIAVLTVVALLPGGTAFAQFAQRGGLQGFVFDPSSAVAPGATVTLLNTAQGNTTQTKSDPTGHFEFTNLEAGQYVLSVSAPGFAEVKSEPLTVNIGASLRYDFQLKTGTVTQSVTVSTTSTELETGQADVDTNVSSQQLEDLPLNGRNFTALAALAPGVSTTPQLNINPG